MSRMLQDAMLENYNYYNDRRVQAAERVPWCEYDTERMTISFDVVECMCSECMPKWPPFQVTTIKDNFFRAGSSALVEQGEADGPEWERPCYLVVVAREGSLPWKAHGPERLYYVAGRVNPRYPWNHRDDEELRAQAARACEWLCREVGFTGEMEPNIVHTHVLPAHYEVCDTCHGKGKHVNPSIDAGGISSDDEFWEDDWDYDGPEGGQSRYMRGDYDVPCYECKGVRVVLDVNEDLAKHQCPESLERYYDRLKDEASFHAERMAELRMGC